MCKLIRLLYRLIPVIGFRAFLNRTHLSSCSKCRRAWAIDKSMEECFTMIPEWIKKERSLWPQIQEAISTTEHRESFAEGKKTPLFFPRWQWALAGLALIILAGVNIVLNKSSVPSAPKIEGTPPLNPPLIQIVHAEISGKKAKPFIYQTKENTFIWFGESNQEED